MHISMTFRHMEATDAIKEIVQEKVERVKKFLQGPIEATVVLSIERYLHVCDVTISAGGQVYKSHEETTDMYTSIDHVMDKIERQIDKTKGRFIAHRQDGE